MTPNPSLDILPLIIPSDRFLTWLRATLEASRQKGREPPDAYWRQLERWERLSPHVEQIAAAMSAEDWHKVEKLLFVATSGDAERYKRARKDLSDE